MRTNCVDCHCSRYRAQVEPEPRRSATDRRDSMWSTPSSRSGLIYRRATVGPSNSHAAIGSPPHAARSRPIFHLRQGVDALGRLRGTPCREFRDQAQRLRATPDFCRPGLFGSTCSIRPSTAFGRRHQARRCFRPSEIHGRKPSARAQTLIHAKQEEAEHHQCHSDSSSVNPSASSICASPPHRLIHRGASRPRRCVSSASRCWPSDRRPLSSSTR